MTRNRVRRGRQIIALRILKRRGDDAAGNTPPVEIAALAQGDAEVSCAHFFGGGRRIATKTGQDFSTGP